MPVETSFRHFQKLLPFVARSHLESRTWVKICFALLPNCTVWNLNRRKLRQIGVFSYPFRRFIAFRRGTSHSPRWNQMFHAVVSGHVFGVHTPGSNCGYESFGRSCTLRRSDIWAGTTGSGPPSQRHLQVGSDNRKTAFHRRCDIGCNCIDGTGYHRLAITGQDFVCLFEQPYRQATACFGDREDC